MRNGILSLSVGDEPRSVTNGTVLVASTDPRFPPATASVAIHRCEYDPATGACALCGETHDTAGLSLAIAQDARYALFATTNMTGFHAIGDASLVSGVNWSISPTPVDGARLHDAPDFGSPAGIAISGASSVWASPGFLTNAYTVTASYPFAPNVTASKTFTTVAIDAEAICTEVDSSGFVVNPISVPIGETATFRIKVFPASVPNGDIQWQLVGESAQHAAFVGSRYGREVRLRGIATGDVDLRISISGYNGPAPTFRTTVMQLYDVPVDAWIVRKDNGADPVTTEEHVHLLIDQANLLLRQICISCYVHQVFYTNRSEWIHLGTYGTTAFNNRFDEMVSVSNTCSGIEVHFVETAGNARGINDPHGMVLTANADASTFAHETGHAFELEDIYATKQNSTEMTPDSVQFGWSQFDWCGNEERGFYPDADSLSQSNLVLRLIMHGVGTPGRKDFSWGDVYGIRHSQANPGTYELGYAPIGVSPGFNPPWPQHD